MDRRGCETGVMTRGESILLGLFLLVFLGAVTVQWVHNNLNPSVRFNVGDEVSIVDTHNFPQNTLGNKGTIVASTTTSVWYRCTVHDTVRYTGTDNAVYEEQFKSSEVDTTDDAKYKRKKIK